jgi:large subunit ribosomal protein L5
MTTQTMPRLKSRYRDEIAPALKEQLGIANAMQVPRLTKIVVNIGIGEGATDNKAIEGAMADIATITGQKGQIRRARKSIAGFKLREGQIVGVKATVRGDRMWEFLDRLLAVAFPRIRDFRGMNPRSFDGNGNYTFGFNEQLVFPEVDYDSVDAIRGMDVTIVTTADTDEHGKALLDAFGFPFARQEG